MKFLTKIVQQVRAIFEDFESVDEETLSLIERLEILERENLFLRSKLERIKEVLMEKND